MATKDEIQATYLAQHNALGAQVDAPDKEIFDQQHRLIWGKCDEELKQRMVELKGQATSTSEEQQELHELELMFRHSV